jgi:hypothetical protein
MLRARKYRKYLENCDIFRKMFQWGGGSEQGIGVYFPELKKIAKS